jgi:hypothetical protein
MKRMFFALLVIALLLAACDEADSGTVYHNDKAVKVYKRPFHIVCDIDKQMGIAFVNSGMHSEDGTVSANIGGVLSGAQYAKWCAPLESEADNG